MSVGLAVCTLLTVSVYCSSQIVSLYNSTGSRFRMLIDCEYKDKDGKYLSEHVGNFIIQETDELQTFTLLQPEAELSGNCFNKQFYFNVRGKICMDAECQGDICKGKNCKTVNTQRTLLPAAPKPESLSSDLFRSSGFPAKAQGLSMATEAGAYYIFLLWDSKFYIKLQRPKSGWWNPTIPVPDDIYTSPPLIAASTLK
jgi:hypothetical protein